MCVFVFPSMTVAHSVGRDGGGGEGGGGEGGGSGGGEGGGGDGGGVGGGLNVIPWHANAFVWSHARILHVPNPMLRSPQSQYESPHVASDLG